MSQDGERAAGLSPLVVAWHPGVDLRPRRGTPIIALADARTAPAFAETTFSPAERERAARFVREENRAEYLLARGIVRTVAAARLGVAPPAVALEAEPNAKPRLLGDGAGDLDVSVSHAAGRVACAFLLGGDVGVDVEPCDRRVDDVAALARRVLSPAELEAVIGSPDPHRAFLRAWTRKEAVLKATGRGLAVAPETVEVVRAGPAGLEDVTPVATEGRLWACMTLEVDGHLELACAFAARD